MSSIKDVAKIANVSVSTVSKVMKGYSTISEDTKARVLKAINELNYMPNAVASALSSKVNKRIAILMNINSNTQAIDEISMQYLHGAISTAKVGGLELVTVFFSMLDGKDVSEIETYFISQNISGIVIFGLSKEDYELHALITNGRFKTVVVDANFVNESSSSVSINHRKAQMDVALETIKGHNCQAILYIKGKNNGYVTQDRLDGILELSEELNLKCIVVDGNFSELQARELTKKYAKEVGAIICASDLMAIGAMKMLVEMDIFRPVCGFDGITLMGYVGKQMNTVKQDFYNIASAAVLEANLLLEGNLGREVVLEHTLERLKYIDIIR